jgi:hypothetical protein
MIESTTAIKGLTGLDVPNLIGGALGRGFGERLRTGEGNSESDAKSAADRISEIAGAGLSTMKAQAAAAAAASKAAAEQDPAKVEAAAAQAPAKVEAAVEKVAPAVEKAADKPWAVMPESKPGAPAAKVVPNDGNVSQWAKWLADQLRRIPDIQVYGTLTLNQLVDHGPASARAVWATAQSVLGKDYGSVTVNDLLKRFVP